MNTLTLSVIVLIVYMGAMMGIGYMGRNTSKNFEEFVTAAKKGSFLMVCGSYMGSHIGNGVVVGGAENGANYGLAGVWYGVGACLSYLVFALVIAKKLYRTDSLTLSECLDKRYGGHITGTIFAVINCGAAISIMAGQITAGKNLFSYLGLNPILGVCLVGLAVFIYAAMSGQWGVMMTDVIQVAVIVACTLISIAYMLGNGAFDVIHAALPAGSWNLFNMDFEVIIMNAIPTMLFGLISAASFQRNVSAKDEKTAVRSAFWGGVLLLPYVFLPVLIGMYGRALFPDAAAGSIIFKVMLEVFPPFVGALMIAALMAAIMSTVDSQLIYVTASITKDIYLQFINKNPDEKKLNRLAKIITITAGLITLYVALGTTSIIKMLSYAYTFMCAGTLVMFVGGIFWKGATKPGAVAASVTGIFFVFLNKFCGISFPYASIFPILPSAVAFVVVSLCTQPKKAEAAK
ncbi:sodium:solute symporter family protein [Pseudoflavonifractor phocaeensis]|uniref:sodium:solute symporter family protein n=1 Tax=Pseudoflavonifractor phocaeensis TaxID=1870988 RepID=UPI001F1A0543|nr:sodium:solute symporter family protein [Pseudoflavonifractor phocaeensis]MCF2662140.1 sodium:solute symporter family protein [Pseudoflavonifractor phocaeensis]